MNVGGEGGVLILLQGGVLILLVASFYCYEQLL